MLTAIKEAKKHIAADEAGPPAGEFLAWLYLRARFAAYYL
jgi:hypothetical protein